MDKKFPNKTYLSVNRGIKANAGFTLIEILIAIVIVSLLAAIAIPSYQDYVDKTNNVTAGSDITRIDMVIERFWQENNFRYPVSLNEAGIGNMLDPWGNAYQYLDFTNVRGNGSFRKDRNLVPINTDYDLYSMGKDGLSRTPLTANHSRDDIVRANNGDFVGLASDY